MPQHQSDQEYARRKDFNDYLDLLAWIFGFAALVTALFIFCAPLQAQAHEWYEPGCCDGRDCAPYLGEVRETKDGYYLPQYDVTIPYRKPKSGSEWSMHSAVNNGASYGVPVNDPYPYHICTYNDEGNGKGRTYIRCFYARQGGV